MTLEECVNTRKPRPVPDTPSSVFEQLQIKGRVVAITGAADGIGFAVAEAMAEAGANVALWYNSNNAAIAKGEELSKEFGVKAKAYQVEVSSAGAVQSAIQQVVQDFGKLDVFVANAGMSISKGILEQSLDEYKKQMSVNVDGVVYCTKYAGEVFKKQGSGNLIITSSMSAHIVNVPVDQPVRIHLSRPITYLAPIISKFSIFWSNGVSISFLFNTTTFHSTVP